MKGIVDVHKAEYGVEPAVVVEVPQVTTLLGSFSEFCSGYALMSTNTHGLRVAVSRREDNQVRVLNSTKKERKKFQLIGIRARKEDKWCTPVKSICQMLQASELEVRGFDLTIKGQSAVADPPAITAAITAGLLTALDKINGYGMEINSLVRMAYNSNRFSDTYRSRLRDLITIFSSEPGKLLHFDLETYECTPFSYPFRPESGVGSWFIDCSLPADELSEEVAIFRMEARKAFEVLKENLPRGTKARNLPYKEIIQNKALSEDWKRLISFVIGDSAAAVKGYEHLLSGDARQLGKVLSEEQRNISHLAGLTSPEVDWLVKRGNESDSIMGVTEISVGITGTLVALMDRGKEQELGEKLEEYERIFGFKPLMREYTPSGSIRIIPHDEYPLI